jgi:hypothetical protein
MNVVLNYDFDIATFFWSSRMGFSIGDKVSSPVPLFFLAERFEQISLGKGK